MILRPFFGWLPLLWLLSSCSLGGDFESKQLNWSESIGSGQEKALLQWDNQVDATRSGTLIYYRSQNESYGDPIEILDPEVSQYTIEGLEVGLTYYFVVSSYSQSNSLESELSNEITYTVVAQ